MLEDEEPRSAVTRAFDLALALLIIVNVSCVILESVESIRRHLASTSIWSRTPRRCFRRRICAARWACVDLREPSYRDRLWGRLRYMRSSLR